MTIRLRPHHLLCMLTFIGEGYTPAFTAHYRRLAARISQGEDIQIVAGPDDICAPLLSNHAPHCSNPDVVERDRQAATDIAAYLQRPIAPGDRLIPDQHLLQTLRHAFRVGVIRGACHGCEWSALCDRVAQQDFQGALVRPCCLGKR